LCASLAQSRSGTTASWRAVGGVGSAVAARMVCACARERLGRWEEVAIVSFALLWRAESRVGFADGYEALRLGWIVGMEVWMVGFGKLVELPAGDRQSDCSGRFVGLPGLTSSRRSAKHL
jgi:hypothetical protein